MLSPSHTVGSTANNRRPSNTNSIQQNRFPTVRHHIQKQSRLVIVKFGGSSLNSTKKLSRAVESIVQEYSHGNRVVVVVSAIGKTTDHLLALTNGGTGIVETDRDDILAMGERTSARVFAASLKSHGILSRYFDPSDRDWPIITDDNFQNANPISKRCIKRIQSFVKPIVEHGIVPVIGGFIGRTVDGRISTLGRGGSDTTALLLASALGADEVVLVTSSNGILTADPRLVSNPKRIPEIDMKALIGIADAGTKFIHRKALRFKNDHIPIRVISNTDANLNSPGTTVTGSPFLDLDVKIHNPHPVASVTLVGSNLSKNPQFIRKIIRLAGSNLEAASQDEDSVIIYLKQTPHFKSQLDKLHRTVLETAEGIAMATKTGMALITVKGIGLEGTPGIVARISETLRSDKINIFGLLTISSSVIVLVEWGKRKRAGRLIKIALRQENN